MDKLELLVDEVGDFVEPFGVPLVVDSTIGVVSEVSHGTVTGCCS